MKRFFLFLMIFTASSARAQLLNNARQKYLSFAADTVQLDTVSIIPGSLYLLKQGILVDSSLYHVDFARSIFFWVKKDSTYSDSLLAVYRVFPLLFSRQFTFRKPDEKRFSEMNINSLYIYSPEERSQELFHIQGLNKSGSISRGITIGNNQDAVVSSSLNLQLSGRLSNNIDVVAAITDDNIPVQPEGNTQQLQEFDKVFIQLSNEKNKLIAGDFELRKPEGYFMNFYKKAQGALFSNNSTVVLNKTEQKGTITSSISGAVSKGRFARNVIAGIESNQGPYRLSGSQQETFIIILSGSERVYIDGQLMARGQANDYVIDYNTAEITFTPRRLITKDSRITVEFQYSDKNYARTLLFAGSQFEEKKWKTRINLYTEQDSKNQPLQQDLSDAQKKLLAAAGDDLGAALSPNVDSVAFNINEILYAKRDTTVSSILYKDIYVYSTNADSAHFRLGFSLVGSNKGDYVLLNTSSNGRVFAWVARVNNLPQGNYEPVVLLATPKKRQMITAGFDFTDSTLNVLSVELAASVDDINTFSDKDKGNDRGWAGRMTYSKKIPVFSKAHQHWNLIADSRYDFTYRNFKPIENYRAVEFTREWNSSSLSDTTDEHNASVGIALEQGKNQNMGYTFRTYQRPGSYEGYMHVLHTKNIYNTFQLKTDASYLSTRGKSINSTYLRHKEEFSRQWRYFITGAGYEEELNEIESAIADSLNSSSFSFRIGQLYIQSADTLKLKASLNFSRRHDDLPFAGKLKAAITADNITSSLGYVFNSGNRITAGVTYRKLQVEDTLVTAQRKDEALLSRIEHQLTAAHGFITANTYYELGTGREQKREFSYIGVATGTGNYAWIDYNGDGIPQLNEFEAAQFQDQANYIRIFTPTAQYVKAFTNQLNMVVNLQPAVFQKKNFLSYFSLLSALRFDNKITGTKPVDAINPFLSVTDDQSLITTNASIRNTLFINRTGQVFGADLTYNDQQTKQLLTNGIETRTEKYWQSNVRVNFSSAVSSLTDLQYGTRKNISEAFTTRNFDLLILKAEEKISYQPGSSYRISTLYNIRQKKNSIGATGEKSLTQQGGLELRYSSVKRGLATATFNLVHIDFNQPENTPLAYEMLEGLKTGINYTWNLSIQRNISSSFQLSINYDGRKSKDVKTIHTGSVQVRAYF